MTYYFYDLETSGLNPKWQRIMQFAGQRTDEDFNPIGEPDNWLIKLTPEVLPDVEAVLITGITPQATLQDGYSEPEFTAKLMKDVFIPGTVALGFNSIRFDDDFIRYTLYRNFSDPYEREWADNRSRWDIVDLVRMTRALRPDGIVWPVNDQGEPTNRLELLSEANGINHHSAHDALSDVEATIGVAKLIKEKQPKLFAHLSSIRNKNDAKRFIDSQGGKPFVHTSSKFGLANLATSVVAVLGPHPTNSGAVLVYDLRYSPKKFEGLNVDELKKLAFTHYRELAKEDKQRLPIKAIQFNKSPAIAPLGVLDEASQGRIGLTIAQVETHFNELISMDGFSDLVNQVWQADEFAEETDPDAMLYSSFIADGDKKLMQQVRNRDAGGLADWHPLFNDDRLAQLLLRYKAKHFPESLSDDERKLWEQYRAARLKGSVGPMGIDAYLSKLEQLYKDEKTDSRKFILEELRLYAESIVPFDNESLF